MKRRWFAVVGAIVLALDFVLALRIGGSGEAAASTALIGIAGALLVIGGLEPLGETIPWYRFVGIAEIIFGAVFVVAWIPPALRGDPSTTQVVLALVGAVNGLVLGLVGLDWFHGGGMFDLTVYEPGPIFAADATEGTEDPPS